MAVDILLPGMATVLGVKNETDSGDVKRFRVDVSGAGKAWRWPHRPGQCAMLSVFGVGECMISVASAPRSSAKRMLDDDVEATGERVLEFAVKNVGRVTSALHELEPGFQIGIRGPYGNGFPVESWKGRRLLFVGGGIGLAPLRSVIGYCLDRRGDYGPIHIIYGARLPGELCFKEDLFENWPCQPDVRVDVTVDRADESWKGPVGFVPQFTEQLRPEASGCVAIACGPPVMIKFTLDVLKRLGFRDEDVFTTLELKMQCGVGKCGRCNIGSRYVCVDGPVFNLAHLRELPDEF